MSFKKQCDFMIPASTYVREMRYCSKRVNLKRVGRLYACPHHYAKALTAVK